MEVGIWVVMKLVLVLKFVVIFVYEMNLGNSEINLRKLVLSVCGLFSKCV